MPESRSFESLRPLLPPEIAASLGRASDLRGKSPKDGVLATGLGPFDALLGGGVPRGALTELVGNRSSGRFSIGLAFLAAATSGTNGTNGATGTSRPGSSAGEATPEAAALVDLGDHLDPRAAVAQGVVLERLLWVRPRTLKEALSATESVLAAGFRAVALDLGLPPIRGRSRVRGAQDAFWLRLARMAFGHDAALLVLSPYRLSGTAATAVLESRGRGNWRRPEDARSAAAVPRPSPSLRLSLVPPPSPLAPHLSHTTLLASLDARLFLEKRRETAAGTIVRAGRAASLSLPFPLSPARPCSPAFTSRSSHSPRAFAPSPISGPGPSPSPRETAPPRASSPPRAPRAASA